MKRLARESAAGEKSLLDVPERSPLVGDLHPPFKPLNTYVLTKPKSANALLEWKDLSMLK